MTPQILDQFEGDKVCGPDQSDKLNMNKKSWVWLRQFPDKMSLQMLHLKLCRELWQHAQKLT